MKTTKENYKVEDSKDTIILNHFLEFHVLVDYDGRTLAVGGGGRCPLMESPQ